ncbi:MAG TPA: aldo/keto reductase [Caulobacteraceae bacterium]|jgi:aryl-alcohol dehydrogenase-like predicted oxidoreductase|nr:aldo/keto reductase [Caulobacteraceae bacterium]
MTRRAAAKLGLGTAQFGLDYGVSNSRGRLSDGEAATVMQVAAMAGVGLVDTAADYGDAESLLGRILPRPNPFRLVTKTAPVSLGVDAVEARARASLQKLGASSADALLVRCGADLLGADGTALWNRLKRLKDEGLFAKIGVAAQADDDHLGLACRFKPDLMQLPASLLDQRLIQGGVLGEIAARGIEVHLRSIFLQGLLFLPRDGLPAGLAGAGPRLSRIRRTLAEAGADPLQAALTFALSRPEASAVVVGVTSAAELRAVLAAAAAPAPDLDWGALALDHAVALDPERWAAA